MTDLSQQTSPGTDSVPGAVAPHGSDAKTVAALQAMLAAMAASLAPGSPPGAGNTPAPQAAPIGPIAGSSTTTTLPAAGPVGFQTRGPWVAGALYQVVPTAPLTLIAEADGDDDPLWYCITRGAYVGVTVNNALALGAVSGVSHSAMKSYWAQSLAVAAFNELLRYNLVAVVA
ncbi:hypothetical protein B0H17DRAFT_1214980 [Mycena rosella]|uniref:Uncharacterized protein n=1 Tax=Mycena rosella TaxID=1033263 RepID=A0AAD7CLP3_MYCRO|nr:hypothetical protein B0H17DRAFT_1214980 [Mycena rosella]